MKQHTQQLKEELQKLGRQIDNVITYGNTILRAELYKVTPLFEGSILKSVMKQLDVETSVDVPEGTILNYRLGIKVGDDYEYLDYGNYIVYKNEVLEDSKKYKLTCYDKMLYAMKNNEDLGVTYPITIKNYLTALATRIGLTVKNASFNNESIQILEEKYVGLQYTYRDILDEIAQATGSIIIINSSDEIELKYPSTTGEIITEDMLKDVNVKFGQKYGPINAVVLSRAGGSDNIYIRDNESVLENGLCEIKIADNQLMNGNDRDQYLQGILAAVDGIYYYLNDYTSTGICYLEVGDFYNTTIDGNSYQCLMLNDEINIDGGIAETVHTELPEESVTDYTKADTTDRKINETYLLVDKQNQAIEAVISNVGEQDTKITQLTATVGELEAKISEISDITVQGESAYASVSLLNVNESEPIRVEIRPIGTNISYLYPRDNLYPSDTLYMPDRILNFHNDTTNEDFTYTLPEDLLYYDANNYDEFILDYVDGVNGICQIKKKVGYNADGTTYILPTPQTINYSPYPVIHLTTGDYTITLPGYNQGYLFVRLMASNIYTAEFATRIEMNSAITQSAQSINLSVDQKLVNYSTTSEMNSAIDLKANQINIEVAKKVNNTDFTHAQIVAKINDNTSEAIISADKINLSGYVTITSADNTYASKSSLSAGTTTINGGCITTGIIKSSNYSSGTSGTSINLSTGVIDSAKFKVNASGQITATGGQIGGFTIESSKLYKDKSTLTANTAGVYIGTDGISLGTGSTFKVTSSGALTCTNADIQGKITATSGNIGGCIISNGQISINGQYITQNTMAGNRLTNNSIETQKLYSVSPSKFISGTASKSNMDSFILETNVGYLKCGNGVSHPYVSALNIAYGGGGLSFRNGTVVGNVGSEIGNIQMDTSGGENVMRFTSAGGQNFQNGTLKILPRSWN